MAAARSSGSRKSSKTRKGRKREVLKDPHGGLTAAGRAWFKRTQGSKLKPGVRKKRATMSDDDMRRKGSWAVRFYGRTGALPPLQDANGKPTRYALSAAAWGEPVPKTVAAARRIAAKGKRLLAAHAKNHAKRKNTAAEHEAGARRTRATAKKRPVATKRRAGGTKPRAGGSTQRAAKRR